MIFKNRQKSKKNKIKKNLKQEVKHFLKGQLSKQSNKWFLEICKEFILENLTELSLYTQSTGNFQSKKNFL